MNSSKKLGKTKTTYQTSTGEKLSQSTLETRLRATMETLKETIEPKCHLSGCADNHDWCHIVSKDDCKKYGVAEWFHDPENLIRGCRDCHKALDGKGVDALFELFPKPTFWKIFKKMEEFNEIVEQRFKRTGSGRKVYSKYQNWKIALESVGVCILG